MHKNKAHKVNLKKKPAVGGHTRRTAKSHCQTQLAPVTITKRRYVSYDLSKNRAHEPLVKPSHFESHIHPEITNSPVFPSNTSFSSPFYYLRTMANRKTRQWTKDYEEFHEKVMGIPISLELYNEVKEKKEKADAFAKKFLALFYGAKTSKKSVKTRMVHENGKKSDESDTKEKSPSDSDTKENKSDEKEKKPSDEKGEKKDTETKKEGEASSTDKSLNDLKALFDQMKSGGSSKDDDDDDDEKFEKRTKDILRHGRYARVAIFGFIATLILVKTLQSKLDTEKNLARQSNTYMQFVQEYLSKNNVKALTIFNDDYVKAEIASEPLTVFFDIINRPDFAARLAIDSQRFSVTSLPIHNVFQRALTEEITIMGQTSVNMLLISMALGFMLSASSFTSKKSSGGAAGLMKKMGPQTSMNLKKEDNIKVRFADVAGMDEAKLEIVEFVDFLKNPEKYNKLGARLPKGALLSGPPGTGKTLLAKATAGEAGVPFYTVSGSEFQQMYVGVGAKRVKELFKKARKDAPSIVFIDEIDAVAKKRSSKGHGSGEREATLNQLLVEMDGFNTTAPVVVFAATNRVEMLDNALTRAGRFDRKIAMDTPDLTGREHIFKVHLAKVKLAADLVLADVAKKVAALTPGLVGADIANVVNEAAIGAARRGGSSVDLIDFDKAVDRVVAGLEKKNDLTALKQRRIVAYHEAGHAIAGWFLENTDPLLKVTIVPRTNGALGFAQYLPAEAALRQVEHLKDMMAMTLGGRAAENIMFGEISTGASDDLSRVARIAQQMISRYGMSGTLTNTAFATLNEDHASWQYISSKTHAAMDREVAQTVAAEYKRVCELLTNKKDLLQKLGDELLKHETLNHDQIVAVLGPRPVQSDEYVDYIKAKEEFDEQKKKEGPAHDADTHSAEKNAEKAENAEKNDKIPQTEEDTKDNKGTKQE